MLVGYPPFFSEETEETYKKIINWPDYFQFPPDITLSVEAQDLICGLLRDKKTRLGINGAREIKIHPFFHGINWKNLRDSKPPFIPDLKN